MPSEKQHLLGQYAERTITYLTATQTLALAAGDYVLSATAAETITLPLPTIVDVNGNYIADGTRIRFVVASAYAHVVNTSSNGFNGSKATATSAGAIGNTLEVQAVNGVWIVVGNSGFTLS
jgi:hypothetical protein